MKTKETYQKLTEDEEISSIIYSLITTSDSIEKKQKSLEEYNPINFLVKCLYDENMPIYNHLEFITRKGGARNIINDVSSYRKIKKYEVKKIKPLKELFKRFNCHTKEDIINFITHIYTNREKEILEKNEIIKTVLMAYQVYYKNNISLNTWPTKKQIYIDFLTYTINQTKEDLSIMDSAIGLGLNSNHGSRVLTMNHLRYYGVKIMIIADGTGYYESENAAYQFCEYMNEWFWKSNPYEENFDINIKNAIKLINYKIGENCQERQDYTQTSASVVVITPEKIYISSIGNTRVYLVRDGELTRIKRKESIYDDIIEKGKRVPFTKTYAQSIPYDTIGHIIKDSNKCRPEVVTIPASFIDGILAISYGVYQNTTDDEIEIILKNCIVEDTAKAISSKAEFGIIKNPKYRNLFSDQQISGSNIVAIYKKDKKKWRKNKTKKLT